MNGLVYKPEESCCATYGGWNVTGMGNADFRAVMTGPVVEVQIGTVLLLARGEYRNNNTYNSGS
ncbi:MAG: hypothetical protein ACREJN_12935 [Nitrospiraceae bacterium]